MPVASPLLLNLHAPRHSTLCKKCNWQTPLKKVRRSHKTQHKAAEDSLLGSDTASLQPDPRGTASQWRQLTCCWDRTTFCLSQCVSIEEEEQPSSKKLEVTQGCLLKYLHLQRLLWTKTGCTLLWNPLWQIFKFIMARNERILELN
jgi:hypothetical protein